MGDYSYIAATVYSAPAELEADIRGILADYDLTADSDSTQLWGEQYNREEAYQGTAFEIDAALRALDGHVAFEVYQAGKYEFDGSRCAQDADGNTSCSSVSNSGEDFVTHQQLVDVLMLAGHDIVLMVAAINKLLGDHVLERAQTTPPPT